jgi:hypothetical protein
VSEGKKRLGLGLGLGLRGKGFPHRPITPKTSGAYLNI